MPLVALTGGIASGKSTVARLLEEKGAVIVDADQIVRDVQSPGSGVLARIASDFGADMVSPDGSLDRAALGSRVFADPDALSKLNAIVHPAVREESQRRFAAAFASNSRAIVVYDVPLLVEARVDDPWDLIVVTHAPAAMRIERLVHLRGMERRHAEERIAAQVADEDRLAVADVIIDTTGSIAETTSQVERLWTQLAQISH
ncbi:dephospho-CoA kinase [Microbacterium halimionae]|uniref:Dephospho-CoA kinase n=1 Tax=Microbacterium halimionae TaxID=1526413 RepID=A0A7W3JNS5_9MICO|nr:dephospho-CoA kinase [Microbacterium halimionae]MBA8816246.1 dephospho-CoA kinase [Microbacterium halimionae]NII96448.1 dephospho-CoA kinase [Microbacterium halimionae]